MKKFISYLLYIYAFILLMFVFTLMDSILIYFIEGPKNFKDWHLLSKTLFIFLEVTTTVYCIWAFKDIKSFYGIKKD